MIEVNDEILSANPKFRIRDSNNNIIMDNLTIEQITPVIQQGTPLNKALFDAIQNWFLNITNNTEIFVTPTLIQNENYNVLSADYPIDPYVTGRKIGIRVPTIFDTTISSPITPPMTQNEQDGYTVYTSYNDGYKAFDNNTSTYASKDVGNDGEINYILISIPKTRVTEITIRYTSFPTGIVYGSSDDGNNWEQIGTLSGVKSTVTTATFNIANKEYTAIKIETVGRYSTSYSTLKIYEIAINGYKNIFNEAIPTYLNINNLGNKIIDEKIQSGKCYTLAYEENKFKSMTVRDMASIDRKYLSIKTGTISDGAIIPQTPNYKHYMYLVSINNCEQIVQASIASSYQLNVGMGIKCSVNQSTRVVVAKIGVLLNTNSSTSISYSSATATYTEVAWN